MRQKGITLVGLVVTIIVLLLLAGISINLTIGENGIITRANEAKKEQAKAEELERLIVVIPEVFVKQDADVNMDNYLEELENKGLIKPEETETNPDGSKEVVTENDYVATIVDKGNGEIEVTINGKVEDLPPRILKIEGKTTTSTIGITVSAKRIENATYRYYYREQGIGEYQKVEESKGNTYTIQRVIQNKKYDVKVEVENRNGKVEGEIVVTTGEIPNGTITFGGVSWNTVTHKATVTVNTSASGYTLQYATSASGPWNTITSGEKTLEYGLDTTVYARLWDGTNSSVYASIKITDGTAPKVTASVGSRKSNSLTVNAVAVDEQSGMPESPSYSFYIKKSNEGSYPTNPSYTGTNSNYTFGGLIQGTGYDVKVTTTDNAGNMGVGESKNQVTESIPGGTITFGGVSWNAVTHKATVTVNTSASGYTLQYASSSNGPWSNISSGGRTIEYGLNTTVYARLWDGVNASVYASTKITDGTAPTVTVSIGSRTTNSITASVSAVDNQSGMPGSPSYSFYIKKTSDANYGGASYTGMNSSYTFGGLTQGTGYDIKVTTADNAGRVGTGTKTNQATGTVPGGTITFGGVSWNASTHKATVTINTSASGYTLQYATSSSGPWSNISSGGRTIEYGLNTTIYARLWDGTNASTYASTKITDGTAPSAGSVRIGSGTGGNNGWYRSNVGVVVTAGGDNQSGVNRVVYTLGGAQNQGETAITSGGTATITADGTTTLTCYTYDNAGNRSQGASIVIKKDSTAPNAFNISASGVTTSGFTISGTASDNTSGIANYTYYVNGGSKGTTGNSLAINGLADGKAYSVYVIAKDNAGNTRQSNTISVSTPAAGVPIESAGLQPGDYVNYPVPYTNQADYWGNTAKNTGWRIMYNKDGKILIVSAGCPTVQLATSLYYNRINKPDYVDDTRCLDTRYGESIRFISLSDFEKILNKSNLDSTDYYESKRNRELMLGNDLITVGEDYFIKEKNFDGYPRYYENRSGSIASYSTKATLEGHFWGHRYVITLKPGVRTSGKDANGVWQLIAP